MRKVERYGSTKEDTILLLVEDNSFSTLIREIARLWTEESRTLKQKGQKKQSYKGGMHDIQGTDSTTFNL